MLVPCCRQHVGNHRKEGSSLEVIMMRAEEGGGQSLVGNGRHSPTLFAACLSDKIVTPVYYYTAFSSILRMDDTWLTWCILYVTRSRIDMVLEQRRSTAEQLLCCCSYTTVASKKGSPRSRAEGRPMSWAAPFLVR